jgi:hypothetical protein
MLRKKSLSEWEKVPRTGRGGEADRRKEAATSHETHETVPSVDQCDIV